MSLLENTVQGGNCNRTISKEAGDFFLVQCKARAIPPAKYKWEKQFNATHWEPIRPEIVKVRFFLNPETILKIYFLFRRIPDNFRLFF